MSNPRHAIAREREAVAKLMRHHCCDCEECEEFSEQLRIVRFEVEEILSRLPVPDTTPASIKLTAH